MAKLKNGLLSACKGGLHSLIFFNRNGKNFVRPKRPQSKSRPSGQDEQKRRFEYASRYCTQLSNTLWRPFLLFLTPKVPEYSSFFKFIINRVNTDLYIEPYCTLSFGNLEPLKNFTADYGLGNGNFTFNWDGTCLGNGSPDDDVSIYVFDTSQLKFIMMSPRYCHRYNTEAEYPGYMGLNPVNLFAWAVCTRGFKPGILVSISSFSLFGSYP